MAKKSLASYVALYKKPIAKIKPIKFKSKPFKVTKVTLKIPKGRIKI